MDDYPYLPRYATSVLTLAARVSPAVVLMGARQTGKTTLVRSEPALRDYSYLTLDDMDVLERATRTPDDLVRSAPRLILDEVQRAPEVILAIKRAVDEDRPRVPGRFILTGSANLLLMERVSESLAGRSTYINLWPLTRAERLGHAATGIWTSLFEHPVREWFDLVRRRHRSAVRWRDEVTHGGYPTPSTGVSDDRLRDLWFDGYVRTYVERDLQDLASIGSLVDFRRLMRAAALRVGSLVNQAEIARDCAIPRTTVHRYLNLLETSFQLVRLPAFAVNRASRIIKTPKLYWGDTGLALHLAGNPEPAGAHLENLVLCDLLAWRDGQIPRPEVMYWRTSTNIEVDFVLEYQGRLLPVEIKASARPTSTDIRGLARFREEHARRFTGGLLLHDGVEVQWLSDRILAVPWHMIV